HAVTCRAFHGRAVVDDGGDGGLGDTGLPSDVVDCGALILHGSGDRRSKPCGTGTRTRLNVTEPVQARLAWFECQRMSRPFRAAASRGANRFLSPAARDRGRLTTPP